ncbi:UV excision repair protein Rad23 [Aaosphaeria arxii CBS 175.79]|uniref:UV excision repair protein RAD23 n=1 Tax=Aaosphaeria arxii CBS 175.79 TaxID=1450172 RepID=A0A6A5XW13_9PLEO|nr:UV excision repair protein Rad23 [Aaosphaeria arxii CBS 175.79]KAF2016434.1 UV excision repair protein Rad23 [Aaosphaeria arxii CBS 175.79]
MKITFKDLKQNKFVIDAEPSETIGELKAKIQADKGWEVSTQKLIYSGKILQDANTVESYNIEEKGFIVCMTSKPKPAASSSKAAPSTPAPAAAQTPAAPAAPAAPAQSSSTQNVPGTPSPAPAQQSSDSTRFNDPSALTMGSERDAAIANMESMGFPRADIDRAMRAAYFNPDRAVEYLLSGIPESALQEQQQQASQGSPRQARGPTSPPAATGGNTGTTPAPTEGDQPINLFDLAAQAGQGNRGGNGGAGAGARSGAGGALSGNSLEFLRNNPQFQQLRQVVQQQPQMLEPILQQVGAGNPQLAQLIAHHPEQFMQLLAEDDDEDAPLPPGAQAISVTEEEREAIERLCRLGFERDLVIQAYFACDKNEELAANFLFDQPEDPEDH